MPLMNFDLEDGQEPVSFTLSSADSERFMAFMADCTDAIHERAELKKRIKALESAREKLRRNRDMYKGQVDRQAKSLLDLRRSSQKGEVQ